MSQTKCSECFDHEIGVYCNLNSCPYLYQNKNKSKSNSTNPKPHYSDYQDFYDLVQDIYKDIDKTD